MMHWYWQNVLLCTTLMLPIQKVYEGCMPIEVLAQRGKDTMRYGPLKPVGLINPKTGHRPWRCGAAAKGK